MRSGITAFDNFPILPRAYAALRRTSLSLSFRNRIKSGMATFASPGTDFPMLPIVEAALDRTFESGSLRSRIRSGRASCPDSSNIPSKEAAIDRTFGSGSLNNGIANGIISETGDCSTIPNARIGMNMTSLFLSLRDGAIAKTVSLVAPPIDPKTYADSHLTRTSRSFRSGMRAGIADFADFPIAPKDSTAADRTNLSLSFSNGSNNATEGSPTVAIF